MVKQICYKVATIDGGKNGDQNLSQLSQIFQIPKTVTGEDRDAAATANEDKKCVFYIYSGLDEEPIS